MTTLQPDGDPRADRIGAIVCFVVAKPHRGLGVAHHLLEAACEGFRQQGFEIVEAYPRKEAQGEAANYHGPLSMYLAAGFVPVRDAEGVVVVRKTLLPP
jgi:ribosomal protein S18 acetylase RimI-like enzyme